jgi:hypothetical protein
MRWTEIIRLRTRPDGETEVAQWLLDLVDHLDRPPSLRNARVLARFAVSADWSIHLDWDTPRIPDGGSELALSVVREIQPFGLLDHLLLVEKRRYTPSARRGLRPRQGSVPRGPGQIHGEGTGPIKTTAH